MALPQRRYTGRISCSPSSSSPMPAPGMPAPPAAAYCTAQHNAVPQQAHPAAKVSRCAFRLAEGIQRVCRSEALCSQLQQAVHVACDSMGMCTGLKAIASPRSMLHPTLAAPVAAVVAATTAAGMVTGLVLLLVLATQRSASASAHVKPS